MERLEILKKQIEKKDNLEKNKKEEILIEVYENGCLLILLNRHEAYNALSLNMIERLREILESSKKDKKIEFIIITSRHPKSFCSGGDIKKLSENEEYSFDFFSKEFQLFQMISKYPKPIISLIQGIIMGGGVGLTIFTKYRIGNESSYLFGMPETSIGLYPDVCGSYFLSRYPPCKEIGLYIGLTGEKLKYSDSLFCNFLTHSVKNDQELKNLENQLKYNSIDKIDQIINRLNSKFQSNESILYQNYETIQKSFSYSNLKEIMNDLKERNDFSKKIYFNLLKKCPTSLMITFELIYKYGQKCSIEQIYQLDYLLTNRMVKRLDFKQGVKSILIDKNHIPKWEPNSIENVNLNDLIKKEEYPLIFY